jgi:3-methyl-2-oxobutanoate hydroxymethyltransferase
VGSVKLEGGQEFVEVVSRIVRASIPVMAHIGLTPQSVHKMGGYVVQGRDEEAARRLVDDAVALERAGCYAVLMEGVPLELAKQITSRLSVPTIGIGAGKHCDGQVLVCYDLLGMNPDFKPKFVKRYANHYEGITAAARGFFDEVREGAFPDEEHSFRSSTIRLVSSNPDLQATAGERDEKSGVFGVPV